MPPSKQDQNKDQDQTQKDPAAQGAEQARQAQADAVKATREGERQDTRGVGGDASVPAEATTTGADLHVTEGASPKFSTKPSDVPVDPRSGQPFGAVKNAGLKGIHGEELLAQAGMVVPGVDPDRIPAEVTPGVSPDASGDRLLAAAQAKAPSLTKEFVSKMGLTDENLAEIANGLVPPPPTPGPLHTADMYRTPGGYQQTPPGVPPQDVGGNQIHRA